MSKIIPYEDQSADALRLSVIEKELDLQQFTILKEGKISSDGIIVVGRIIGGSHILTYQLEGKLELYEVFACTDITTSSKIAYCGPLERVLGSVSLELPKGITYAFASNKTTWKAGEKNLLRLQNIVSKQTKPLALSFTFPQGRDIVKEAQTIVTATVKSSVIQVETLHSYPNEDTLVFTESIITMNRRRT